MKILCGTTVVDRQTQSRSAHYLKATLAVGFHCGAKNADGIQSKQLEIIHFTPQNKNGVRYKVQDNIEKLSTKFLRDGKATIWFRQPPVNLMINCDPIQLKGFLQSMKLGLDGKESLNLRLNIASTTAIPQKSQPLEKLTVIKRGDYPTKGFPRTLKQLKISTIKLSKITFDICSLRNLTMLDLSENKITKVPREMGRLPLTTFNISNNELGSSNDWQWLQGKHLRKSLCELDLSANEMQYFPLELLRFGQLVTLKMNNNFLKHVPFGMRRMSKLRYLHVCSNKLASLPSDFNHMCLDVLDVWGNKFATKSEHHLNEEMKNSATPLWMLAARAVCKFKLPHTAATLPWTLVDILAESPKCACNKLCYASTVYESATMATLNNVKTLVSGRNFLIHADIVLCGPKCKGRRDMLIL